MPETNRRELHIWSDGACKGNPGPGGWGARLIYGQHVLDLYGGEVRTTNNRMELSAVIAALSVLKRPCPMVIHTDSQYVKNGVCQWMASWKKRGWTKAGGRPVKNAAYWKRLDELLARHEVQWQWVKGHAGVAGNEAADSLANRGVEAALGLQEPCAAVSSGLRAELLALGDDDDFETDLP